MTVNSYSECTNQFLKWGALPSWVQTLARYLTQSRVEYICSLWPLHLFVGGNPFAAAATILLSRLLPTLTPLLAIRMCVLVIAVLSWLNDAMRPSDVGISLGFVRKAHRSSREL
jgi:hypothetical protein